MEMIYFCRLHGRVEKVQALRIKNWGLGSTTYQLQSLGQSNSSEPQSLHL